MTFLKAEVLVYQNNLKTAFYAAEPCRQYLTADTLWALAVKAGSILRAWCINAKTLCINWCSLISCPAHRVCLGSVKKFVFLVKNGSFLVRIQI